MNLVGKEHRSGRSSEDGSLAMHHTYEVSLLAPGEGLTVLNEGNSPTNESEGMMKNEQQMSMAVLSDEEIGTLSLITYKKIIRRAYLNSKMISTEIDTCSLVSIVMSDDPRLNRMLRIRRRLNTCSLTQRNQRMKNIQEDEITASIRTKPEAHTIEEDPRNDKTTANDASMNTDPSIVYCIH